MRCVRVRFSIRFFSLLFAGTLALGESAVRSQDPPATVPGEAPAVAEGEAPAVPPAEGDAAAPARPKFDIPDEPRSIDPSPFIPPKLTEKATVEFVDASLREVVDWLQRERGIPTLVDEKGLEDAALTIDARVDDRLTDEPVYFLLDRLAALDLAWYVEDDILHLTSRTLYEEDLTTISLNVGDLYDAGYDGDTLIDVITATVDPESWPEFGGTGNASIRGLGDVLIVSQTEQNLRTVQCLLAALRTYGRMTRVDQPPSHDRLRELLDAKATVDFRGVRLEQAMKELGALVGAEIRLDERGLDEAALTDRVPVTISLKETRLSTTLDAMLTDLDLDWLPRYGTIWITSRTFADETMQIAVFDVRDLTIDGGEADSLIDAITSTIDPESWPEFGGTGSASIRMPIVGTLVVSQTERNLAAIADLLARYREAIAQSRPRKPKVEDDPQEIVTKYYRLPAAMAEGLRLSLPSMAKPESWKTNNPDGPGVIYLIPSAPELPTANPQGPPAPTSELFVARATLVITHTRETHEEIVETIQKIESGDGMPRAPMIMGMGGGGFGGGLPVDATPAPTGGMGGGGGFGGF